MEKVLITGGAGFIGSFIVDKLIEKGYDVTILDNLEEQVHDSGKIPKYLNPKAKFIKGDITDYELFKKLVLENEIIFHKAASIGIAQSNYEIVKFVKTNSLGTANLLNILVNENHNVKKIIIPSSNTMYGEGLYECENCGKFHPKLRTKEYIEKNGFEIKCPNCNELAKPIPTNEETSLDCNSIYAITKKNQEENALFVAKTYGIPIVILRFFSVIGPRQSLSNPYTGVIPVFGSRLMNDKAPIIYEDGLQTRDSISVHDVVDANIKCMESNSVNYDYFNIGTQIPVKIKDIALMLARLYNKKIEPKITLKGRAGDTRHCTADITKIKNKIDWEPKVKFEDALKEIVDWSKENKSKDKFEEANEELKKKGLL